MPYWNALFTNADLKLIFKMNLIHTGFKYKDLKFQSVNLFTKQQRLISSIIRPCRIEHEIIGHAALPIPGV